jgi:hypothetical protein
VPDRWKIDGERQVGRPLDRKFSGVGAAQDFAGDAARLPEQLELFWPCPPPVLPDESSTRRKNIIIPKTRIYDIKKPARLDKGDVMAIRHQT